MISKSSLQILGLTDLVSDPQLDINNRPDAPS